MYRAAMGTTCPSPNCLQQMARTVVVRNGVRGGRLFWSRKMARLIPTESGLEADFLTLSEVNNKIVSLAVQPEKVTYFDENAAKTYYPDVRLDFEDGTVAMVEVKPACHARKLRNRRRFNLIAEHYRLQGTEFLIVTEGYIRKQPRLLNARHLLAYQRHAVHDDLKTATTKMLAAEKEKSLGELGLLLVKYSPILADFYSMALQGLFDIDIETERLSFRSVASARKLLPHREAAGAACCSSSLLRDPYSGNLRTQGIATGKP